MRGLSAYGDDRRSAEDSDERRFDLFLVSFLRSVLGDRADHDGLAVDRDGLQDGSRSIHVGKRQGDGLERNDRRNSRDATIKRCDLCANRLRARVDDGRDLFTVAI